MTGKQIRGHRLTFSQDIYPVTVTSYLTVSFPVAYVLIEKTLPQNKEHIFSALQRRSDLFIPRNETAFMCL
jgi:hypothetical protein